MPKLTAARLRELLECDPESGTFTWKVAVGKRIRAGTLAGTPRRGGYVKITIAGKGYFRHRLVWFYVHGKWPPGRLDHKDGVELGDGIKNLRVATQSQNMANTGRHKDNTSGFKGVYRHRKNWRAQIHHNGRLTWLGSFGTPEAAHEAYKRAAGDLQGEFARFE